MDCSLGEYIAYQICDFSEGDFGVFGDLVKKVGEKTKKAAEKIPNTARKAAIGGLIATSLLGGANGARYGLSALNDQRQLKTANSIVTQWKQDDLVEARKNLNDATSKFMLTGSPFEKQRMKSSSDTVEETKGVLKLLHDEAEKIEKETPGKIIKASLKGAGKGAATGTGIGGLGVGVLALGKAISNKKKKKLPRIRRSKI